MIYPESLEKKIGFDGVRSSVAALCAGAPGKERCEAMTFMTDCRTVRRELERTAEMLRIISSDDGFPSGNSNDCRRMLYALRVPGSWVEADELSALRSSIATLSQIALFFSKLRKDDGTSPYPELDSLAADIAAFPEITRAIDKVLDAHGEIKDNASPELTTIRRSMSSAQAGISAAMRRVMAQAVSQGIIDADASPSVRDGRLVIPVAPMHKRKISGIVHDESASGKTVYIEPAEVVEANNRLRELEMEERREITRILQTLADIIRPNIDDLLDGFELLGIFDFIYAKAKYAKSVDAEMPALETEPEMDWYGARHPGLLQSLARQGKEIVPLDIQLNADRRILVVSGPNAGGKSVTLKTVAVVQYMLQCGLLPTVYSNSRMGMFESIFIDIGDDQSIEDDLSTYSSHLRNMKYFLSHGNAHTLVLIDEFGSGTEPQIGGAIAQALLKQFNAKGMWGVITTHYHNLKQFADETPGLVNGSMLYDRQAMRPLFKLTIGHPGSSFAIEIARKTGLPDDIIADAREIVGSDYVNMDKYLLDIARDRRYWENKRADIRRKEKEVDEILAKYSDAAENLRRQRNEIIGEAKQEARRILDSSNAAIERTIRDIRTSQADKEATRKARRDLEESRKALTDESEASHPLLDKVKKPKTRTPKQAVPDDTRPLAVGDNVVLDGGNVVGTIDAIEGKEAQVVFGQMRTTVKLNRLKRTIRKAQSGASAPTKVSSELQDAGRQRQLEFSNEIDLRGMRADEAVQAVMYYIDDAIQYSAGRVRILHGTGTGALRLYIRRYLDTVAAVKNYHDEDVRFGGAGITVVELE